MQNFLTMIQSKSTWRVSQPLGKRVRKSGYGITALRLIMHIGALLPLELLVAGALAGKLTVNPIQEATQQMGRAAILLLVVALAVSPLKMITGIRMFQKLARPLGLYAFFYALVHLLIYVGLDYGFDLSLLLPDIVNKQYIYVGIAASLILFALALTSFRWWMKLLGKFWKYLHRLVYLAGLLAVIHYGLAVKGDLFRLHGNIGWPVFYGGMVMFLLGVRIPKVRRCITKFRERLLARFLERKNAV
jgi:methionine sulfoxide reductase heme-binding subunit